MAGQHRVDFQNRAAALIECDHQNGMRDFKDNRDVGIQLFLNSIDTINEVSNRPVELLFDRENIYICA